MIGYVTIGTNDVKKASQFYDALLGEIGAKRGMENERFVMWSASPNTPGVAIIKPFDGKPATVGNGVMIALTVDNRAKVDALHKKALELGGKCEGAPGERSPGFYAAYFRDLEGNKFAAFKAGS